MKESRHKWKGIIVMGLVSNVCELDFVQGQMGQGQQVYQERVLSAVEGEMRIISHGQGVCTQSPFDSLSVNGLCVFSLVLSFVLSCSSSVLIVSHFP